MTTLDRAIPAAMILMALNSTAFADAPRRPANVSDEELMHCPAWVHDDAPAKYDAYRGRAGLPEPLHSQPDPIGVGTWGVDYWQANNFIVYRPETADYLYKDYTPTKVDYRRGTFPTLERIVKEYSDGLDSDRDKAVALLTGAMPKLMKHPAMAPLGPVCQTDRDLSEEDLVRSGKAFCNEQARVFVRLCQVAGIPARLVFLFYAAHNGHVVVEFFADGQWCMADASWFCVFPDASGHLMSAAECHKEGEGKLFAGKAYRGRFDELIAMPDDALVGGRFVYITDPAKRAERIKSKATTLRAEFKSKSAEELADDWWVFGILNYPLPE